MARAAVKLGVREVAAAAKVSPATLTRVEGDQPANASTLAAIQTALEAFGVKFVEQNGIIFHGSTDVEMEAADS